MKTLKDMSASLPDAREKRTVQSTTLRENLSSKSLSAISDLKSSMRSKMKLLRNTLLFSVTTSDAVNLLNRNTSLRENLHEKVTADASKTRDDSYERQLLVSKIGPLESKLTRFR